MASLLDGALKRLIAQGFKGRLKKGKIRLPIIDSLDDLGNPQIGTALQYDFEGITQTFSALYRAQANIEATDVGILVLLGSTKVEAALVENFPDNPDQAWQSCQIYLNGLWHQVRKLLERDPAGASALFQVYVVPDPTVEA